MLAAGAVNAAENADHLRRAALRGLKGCAVVAMSMNKAMTSEKARSSSLARLRTAKIPVFEDYEGVKNVPGRPTLTVVVADFVSLRLAQEVLLKRDPSIGTVAETWSSNCVVGPGRTVEETLDVCLDEFARDFRAANRRR